MDRHDEWQCDECGRRFGTRGGLWKHKSVHTKEAQALQRQVQQGAAANQPERVVNANVQGQREILPVWDETPLTDDNLLNDLLRRHWRGMTTHHVRGNIRDIVNFRLWDVPDNGQDYDPGIVDMLSTFWRGSRCSLKMNCSVGVILKHKTTGEYKYFHSSTNNAAVFDVPVTVRSEAQMLEFYEDFRNVDIAEQALQRRPNTVWQLYRITNVTFVAYKLLDVAKIGAPIDLPNYVKRNRSVVSLTRFPGHRVAYEDNLCFFRCLAMYSKCLCSRSKCTCTSPDESVVRDLYHQFASAHMIRQSPTKFPGVTESHLLLLEKQFEIAIIVMELEESDIAQCTWASGKTGERKMFVNRFGNHFSYIRNIDTYTLSFQCRVCDYVTKRGWNLATHRCQVSKVSRLMFAPGQFSPRLHIFAEIERDFNIEIPPDLRFSSYCATYDIECFLPKSNLPVNTPSLEYTSRHEFLSVSACSNVPGFDTPLCFVRDKTTSTQEVIDSFVTYLHKISEAASNLTLTRFSDFFEKLCKLVENREGKEVLFANQDISAPGVHARRSGCNKIVERLRNHVRLLSVVGFNSQKYDLNVIKPFLVHSLFDAKSAIVQAQRKMNDTEEEVEEDEDDDDSRGEKEHKPPRKKRKTEEYNDKRAISSGQHFILDDLSSGEEDVASRKRKKKRKHKSKYSDSDGFKSIRFVVRRANAVACLQTEFLHFLDILNFLAPGFSYAAYLKAFGCSVAKGFFPYEWMDCLEKLENRELPPREAFFSSLNGTSLSEEDYGICLDVWRVQGMKTFRDFLVWYNNLDVEPFLEAIAKQTSVYRQNGIDMLKEAISLPGLAVNWLFKHSRPHFEPPYAKIDQDESLDQLRGKVVRRLTDNLGVSLIDFRNKDIYDTVFSNIVGGPSIVFCRYHEAGKTIIREAEGMGKICKKIHGVDANGLYLWAICQEMPTGYPKRWKIDELGGTSVLKFQSPAHLSRAAVSWLEYVSVKTGKTIRHRLNGGEHSIGQHGIPVDGMCFKTNTVYQFHGCYWHGHCCGNHKGGEFDIHPQKQETFGNLRKSTELKDEYIQSLGYNLTIMWECEWKSFMRSNRESATIVSAVDDVLFKGEKRISQDAALEMICSGEFFGFIECDIHVPELLKEKFAEMSPIFKNVDVGREHLSSSMHRFAEENDFLSKPQRMLIGSDRGVKILLLSSLASWYLAHGLEITRIYQLIRYTPRKLFTSFGESVTAARREGDEDPSKAIQASTHKLVGNAVFGKSITRKEKFRDHCYTRCMKRASTRIQQRNFVSLDDVGSGVYEMSAYKKKVSSDFTIPPRLITYLLLQRYLLIFCVCKVHRWYVVICFTCKSAIIL